MNLFTQPLSTQDANLVDALLENNIEEFLHELVTGTKEQMPEIAEIAENKAPEMKPEKKNTSRQYIQLPDARIRRYKHQSWLSETKRDNASTNKGRKRINNDRKRRFSNN